jgi:DNA-binding NarL/FixJ family response regulator
VTVVGNAVRGDERAGAGIRLVMADDHAPTRGAIRAALERSGCEVCGAGATAQEAIELALEHEPDVALLDVHMPGNGIRAARVISERLPQTAVVMLTASQEDEDLFEGLRAGASGYLLKTAGRMDLALQLKRVLAGEAAIPPRLVARMLEEFRAPRRDLLRRTRTADALSPREREVMGLLAGGMTTDAVARHLFVSPTTVRVHVSTVLRKLQVKDRQSAFRLLRGE